VSGILRRIEALNWGVGIARRVGTMKLPPNESVPNPEPFPWITVRLRVIKWTAEKMEKLLPALRELVAELEEKGGGAKLQEGSSWHR